ncbi:hypothetical protein DCAR_0520773 [Daucus carota subsp. sativus]|uniref:Glucose-methanol-choline oxidoreductase N-terminal domain-containing protein n=1 Tax=Daucus carota subsp. sativus TaxID=79200 RepID=A0AAF0X415_DAUCS|nr:hypothetical protein DCAR_0520773 [Daucus carota subsp. sativus]
MILICWRFVPAAIAATIFFLPSPCYSEPAPFASFAKNSVSAPPVAYYDYIIVGGGTAGCALAATLSEAATVLLLERGGLPYNDPRISNVAGFAYTLSDISPGSPSQLVISTDGVITHRARVLGGGTALNAGFYTRASSEFVTRSRWDPKLVEESYEWVEKVVAHEPQLQQFQSAVREGMLEVGMMPDNGFTYEHIQGTKTGGSTFDRNGKRHTAADLLQYADPAKIAVHLHATVQRILFKNQGKWKPRADGVEFRDSLGASHTAYLTKDPRSEVILAAGAIGSPQLMMLSGVGPAEQLRSKGIDIVLDQPMVGQGMADNPMNALIIPSPNPIEISLIQPVGITPFGSYIESASRSIDLTWALKLPEGITNKTKQYGVDPNALTSTVKGFVDRILRSPLQAGIILEKIMGPVSSGHLELLTLDAKDNPLVTFNYFKEPEDLEKCVKGMEMVIKVAKSRAMARYRYPLVPAQALINTMLALPINLRPRHLFSTLSLEQYCKDTVMSIWHYHGGCQVGKVVDYDYKVVDIDALRVVDSSTFTFDSPGTNPQATVMMLGRYVGQRILQERGSRKKI